MPRRIKAKEFMTQKVITLDPKMDVFEAMQLLIDKKISGAPVIDADGALLGVFGELECLRLLAMESYHTLPGAHVEGYMRTEPLTIEEETDLLAIAHIFMNNRFRRVPVLREGRLVGIVSRWDVMRMIRALRDRPPEQRESGLYLSALDE